MLDKLNRLCERYEQLSREIADSACMENMDTWRALVKEHAALEEIVTAFRAHEITLAALDDCKAMLK